MGPHPRRKSLEESLAPRKDTVWDRYLISSASQWAKVGWSGQPRVQLRSGRAHHKDKYVDETSYFANSRR